VRPNATSIFGCFDKEAKSKRSVVRDSWESPFGQVDGLLGVGPSKSFLPQVQIRLSSSPKKEMLRIVVMRHNILDLEGGSLVSYIDTQNAFLSVHSAAPQLPIT
jgi:hypothetical protein